MNWKTRQMFSDREHGIVSGLSPVNMMGGGSVPIPGYQNGGLALDLFEEAPEEPSIEQRVAELAAQQGISVPAARAMILKQMIQEKGLTLSDEIINQFATGLITLHDALAQAVGPPKMQGGGLALDLFEEGDEEINEPLNIMAQAVSPSLSDITPTETVEETVTLTEDQGPTDVSALKKAFQELAMKAVDAAKDAIAQGASVEQVQGPLQERLMMIDEQYRQKSGTQDTILTEEFLIQLGSLTDISAEVVSMQDGGEVPLREVSELDMAQVDLYRAEGALAAHKAKRRGGGHAGMSRYDARTKILEAAVQTAQEKVDLLLSSAENVTGTPTDGPAADVEAKAKADAIAKAKIEAIAKAKADAEAKENKEEKKDIIPALTTQGFWEEMKANAARARRGTMMSGKSKQGGILGTMDVLGQAEIAGAKSLGDAQEAMLRELGAGERIAATLGKPTSLTKEERDLDKGSILLLSKMFADNVQKADGDIFEAMEQFTRAGYKIPANLKGLITGTVTITDTKGNTKKDMPFSDYYRLREGKTDSKGKILTFEEIAAEFSKLVAAGGVYDARNP